MPSRGRCSSIPTRTGVCSVSRVYCPAPKPPPRSTRSTPNYAGVMDAFPTAVAYIVNRRLDMLAADPLADALLEQLSDGP